MKKLAVISVLIMIGAVLVIMSQRSSSERHQSERWAVQRVTVAKHGLWPQVYLSLHDANGVSRDKEVIFTRGDRRVIGISVQGGGERMRVMSVDTLTWLLLDVEINGWSSDIRKGLGEAGTVAITNDGHFAWFAL